ncbi:MAG TPA: hypothetical protein ENK18_12115 [Deltaproteobacteria bacterium]|nr:hypothetical protein [Deltaproteobacteria bacterium]
MPPLLLLLVTRPGWSQSSSQAFKPRPIAGHAVLDLRVGVDRIDTQHPFLCAEISPLSWLSVEGCGTGSGFLHQDPNAPDMAHFRTRARAASVSLGRTTADLLLGAGFAEVQRTADQPGFLFGPQRDSEQIEAAGPEASASIKGRYWLDAGGRTYAAADLNAGVAAIPAAPVVIGNGGPIVPFASLTLGFGF